MIWLICWLEFWAVALRPEPAPVVESSPVTDLRQWRRDHPKGRVWP
jgi:hypothetical protein